MNIRYKSLNELYSLTGLTIYQIAKKIHKSPHTMRKWKSIEDVPERILYKIENLVIYRKNRKHSKEDLIYKLTQMFKEIN